MLPSATLARVAGPALKAPGRAAAHAQHHAGVGRTVPGLGPGRSSTTARPQLQSQSNLQPQSRRNLASVRAYSASAAPRTFAQRLTGRFRSLLQFVAPVFRTVASSASGRTVGGGAHAPAHAFAFRGFGSAARPSFAGAANRLGGGAVRFGPRLPVPSAVSRGIGQVGLGTARTFTSSRPIFQNLVHNAPLTLRALADEAEDEAEKFGKMKRARQGRVAGKPFGKESVNVGGTPEKARRMNARTSSFVYGCTSAADVTSKEDVRRARKEKALKHFFKPPQSSQAPAADESLGEVTTHVLIPLDPCLAALLSSNASGLSSLHSGAGDFAARDDPLVSASLVHDLYQLHQAYETHAARVGGIVRRLEDTGVLGLEGVQVALVGPAGIHDNSPLDLLDTNSGQPNGGHGFAVRVSFKGSTKAQVKQLLGRSWVDDTSARNGRWFEIVEVKTSASRSDGLSRRSSSGGISTTEEEESAVESVIRHSLSPPSSSDHPSESPDKSPTALAPPVATDWEDVYASLSPVASPMVTSPPSHSDAWMVAFSASPSVKSEPMSMFPASEEEAEVESVIGLGLEGMHESDPDGMIMPSLNLSPSPTSASGLVLAGGPHSGEERWASVALDASASAWGGDGTSLPSPRLLGSTSLHSSPRAFDSDEAMYDASVSSTGWSSLAPSPRAVSSASALSSYDLPGSAGGYDASQVDMTIVNHELERLQTESRRSIFLL